MFRSLIPFAAFGEFYFKDPDTAQDFSSHDMPTLLKKIADYRSQNQLEEIFQLEEVVTNYLCLQKANVGKCGKNPRMDRSWWTSLRGGVALLVNMLIKNPVPQAVADIRGKQCASCKYNVFPDKGRFVKWSDRITEASVPGKRSAYHTQLGNCSVCTCVLKAKVFMPGPFKILPEEEVRFKEVSCWQLEK